MGESAPACKPAQIAAHLDAQELYRQLQRVILAARTDDTLPTLMAVQMPLGGHTLTLAATTDRYRFAVADVPATRNPDHPATTPEHPMSALIPSSVLTRLTKHLKTQTGPVAIAFGTPELTLTTGDTTLTIQPRHGDLPGYAALFPTTVDTSLASRSWSGRWSGWSAGCRLVDVQDVRTLPSPLPVGVPAMPLPRKDAGPVAGR